MEDLFDLRRNYSLKTLDIKDVTSDPVSQFEVWINEAISAQVAEPNAMTLSTSTPEGKVSSRVVLLKQVKEDGFVFFTNYDSKKATQIDSNPYCALNFLWLELERQVRIEGIVSKISPEESDLYFNVRPEKSKLGAWSSPQSKEIPNREYLDGLMSQTEKRFDNGIVTRPENWGGYIVKPLLIEFWQGRSNRLHDRICYTLENNRWHISRLAP
ncbi:pyridoxamine 5'-phosphate oxidase [Dysgonomonas sp. 520]|uniref:pyridoxamine 5'-phosphate oxidase n=1 Tax=Dysgonomonas sp. 520 TaxID=2302931 RepID=UPI0013D4A835|nr:pyridoxamine 5'-phosphate oxidase [Dysgonomonas sp. 520]NDW08097.1 pyridoxamine 5'-phosphate oxidase [Dysgonomonas sp. 520]